jgi:hypothetical protein
MEPIPTLTFCHCGQHGRITWSNGMTGTEMIAKDAALEILHTARFRPSEEREFAEIINASALPASFQDLSLAMITRYEQFILLRIKHKGRSPVDPHEFLFSSSTGDGPIVTPPPNAKNGFSPN